MCIRLIYLVVPILPEVKISYQQLCVGLVQTHIAPLEETSFLACYDFVSFSYYVFCQCQIHSVRRQKVPTNQSYYMVCGFSEFSIFASPMFRHLIQLFLRLQMGIVCINLIYHFGGERQGSLTQLAELDRLSPCSMCSLMEAFLCTTSKFQTELAGILWQSLQYRIRG